MLLNGLELPLRQTLENNLPEVGGSCYGSGLGGKFVWGKHARNGEDNPCTSPCAPK